MSAIYPNWQAPKNIKAFTTVRTEGVSQVPFDSFNLGDHVGDLSEDVRHNRALLVEKFGLPQEPLFLTQTHSTTVIELPYLAEKVEADAVYTKQANQVCLVMTADCLPVIFCNKEGTEVAAAHAGWRGLCNGILEETVTRFQSPASDIMAWLGPAIGPTAFQVGEEVVEQFCAFDPNARLAFLLDDTTSGRFLSNLYQLAIQRLNKVGVQTIFGGEHCTYTEKDKFFSYRRDTQTGRMATLIWLEER